MKRWDKNGDTIFSSTEGWKITSSDSKKSPVVDTILGTDKDDFIQSGYDNDNVCARGGDDKVHGDLGDDYLAGEDGNDELQGLQGDDTLVGGPNTDQAYGGIGNDSCDAEFKSNCEL